MPLYVSKFGGTSMRDRAMTDAVTRIVRADSRRRVIVVSAPGKRYAADEKVTDLLSRYAARGDIEALMRARARFYEIAGGESKEIDSTMEAIIARAGAADGAAFAISRGEYLSARLLAQRLGYAFVDAERLIYFTPDGTVDAEKTHNAIQDTLFPLSGAVVPGFYGMGANGVTLFPRGGSDITGAILASALRARLYENWTDVNGVYQCDPAKDPNAKRYARISYDRMLKMSVSGAQVVHPDALIHAAAAGVPTRVLNTFRPDAPSTMIVGGHLYKRSRFWRSHERKKCKPQLNN